MGIETRRIVAATGIFALGLLLGRTLLSPDHGSSVGRGTKGPGTPEVLYWVAPMDPSYRRDGPGKSPMGMDLVPVYAGDEHDPDSVRIDPVMVANLGVRTVAAERSVLPRRIDTVGYVGFDEETIQHVHTRVEGWIESLAVNATGDPVLRGQKLFELYSPALVNAQREYLAAVSGGNESLLGASRERLSALGMDVSAIQRLDRERTVNQRVAFMAEVDGVIAYLGVREGNFVTPAKEVLSVARLDSVWVIAEVLERQADWVAPRQTAAVSLDQRPGEVRAATVDYVYPELDPQSRTLRVRLRLDNTDLALRPNMFARVSIEGEAVGPIVNVPRSAVIRSGNGQRVVVAEGKGRFSSRNVLVGIESGDRVAIRSGLSAGDHVVVSGQFLIDSESNADSALERIAPTVSVDSVDTPTDAMHHDGRDQESSPSGDRP